MSSPPSPPTPTRSGPSLLFPFSRSDPFESGLSSSILPSATRSKASAKSPPLSPSPTPAPTTSSNKRSLPSPPPTEPSFKRAKPMSDDSELEDFSMGDDDDEDMMADDDDSASDLAPSDDGADFDFDEDMGASKTLEKKPYLVDFKPKDPGDLRSVMDSEVEKVRGIFDMDVQTATFLLRSFHWNREKLVEKYMDAPEECLAAAGLDANPPSPVITTSSLPNPGLAAAAASPIRKSRRINPRASLSTTSSTASASSSSSSRRPTTLKSNPSYVAEEEFSCPICCLDFAADVVDTETLALGCGHRACKECWGMYLEGKIKGDGESVRIQCLESGCDRIVSEKVVDGLMPEEAKERYHELLSRTYVEDNPTLRYCPAPECEYAIECKQAPPRVLNSIIPIVTCHCDQVFCFGCGESGDHRPVVCKVAKFWRKKCADDSETSNWISANTKECDKCHSTIEKNGGCNHMTCKKCKHEFCWICMGPWSEHGTAWYNCNRYEEKSGAEARDGQSKSRASLERYLHYYNRWANHELSAKLDRDLYAKTEKKMEEMQVSSELTWIEVQFAKKAVDTLVIARMTLKWTYAMAFYLVKNNETALFEDNQADLEQAVESLSEMLEKPIDKEGIPALRQAVTDKTVYVQKRQDILLDDTLQGYLEGRWSFTVDLI